jgi:hypothetical protein
MEVCNGDKAIGFCVSIKHAKRMAEYFNENGVSAIAITSEQNDDRIPSKELIQAFKSNAYSVAFTIDMFNEGIDVPNVRALMFLRPTESKTVFTQQLGRGLRLSTNKEQLIILDFIGNYKRANKIREYLSKGKSEKFKEGTGAFERYEYHFNPKCNIHFDESIQEIFDTQDRQMRDISKEDLIDTYYEVAETIKRKPSKDDLDSLGRYKASRYVSVFGSWFAFLREINELTESSYHYPQGTHWGHVLYILDVLANGKRTGSYLDDNFVKMRGNLDSGRLGAFQRQTKYKLQAMMEMGLVLDDRGINEEQSDLILTNTGKSLYKVLEPLLATLDFSFKNKESKAQSWEMELNPEQFTRGINAFLSSDKKAWEFFAKVMLQMDAVQQLVHFVYADLRKNQASKGTVYELFFKSPAVVQYCERNGIEPPSDEGSKRRLPFLISIIECMGIVRTDTSNVYIEKLLLCNAVVRLAEDETTDLLNRRKISIVQNQPLDDEVALRMREQLGKDFLTQNYHINDFIFVLED